MSYKNPPPWRTRYATPKYITRNSPVVYPDWSPDQFAMGGIRELLRERMPRLAGPQKKYMAPVIPQGPFVSIGPFLFNPKGDKRVILQSWFGSQAGLPTQRWIAKQIGAAAPHYMCLKKSGTGPLECLKSYNGWTIDRFMARRVWDGRGPIAISENPITGETFAILVKFEPGKLILTYEKFRPPKGWKHAVLSAFKAVLNVVAKIIETVADFFELLKDLACAAVKPATRALLAYATGGVSEIGGPPSRPPGMSAEEYSAQRTGWEQLKHAGITNKELEKLKSTASATVATEISNKLSKKFCGGQDVIADTTPDRGWLLPVAIVGGVGAIAYILSR